MNPLPADFKFPLQTFQQLVLNYLLGDSTKNIPPYSSLTPKYVRHNKSDATSLRMMKLLMSYVKKVAVPKGVWYNKSTEWTYARYITLWDTVSNTAEFKDVLKGNRRKELSWKTVYNRLSAKNVFKGQNRRKILRTNDIVDISVLETLADVVDKSSPVTTTPSLKSAASSAQSKTSTSKSCQSSSKV